MILIGTDGKATDIAFSNDLETLQKLVEGYIEFFRFDDGSALIVNEEGKLRGMPLNVGATGLATIKKRPETIVGPALFVSKKEMHNFTSDVDA